MQPVCMLVEGDLDEAVARRLLARAGAHPGHTFGKRGVAYIRQKIRGFARSSAGMPILVLVDLMDTGLDCAPDVVGQWLPDSQRVKTLFRVVVPEIESWLLADREGIADFLRVRLPAVPTHPDELEDPKRTVIDLAKSSRLRDVRTGIVPAYQGVATGPLYNSLMVRFVRDSWDVSAAAEVSPSLARATAAVESFLATL